MKFPIVAYGHPNLRKVSEEIDENYPDLDKLIEDMFETMYQSNGVGLAAAQINLQIRLFIVDASPYAEKVPETKDFKKVFINPIIEEETGELWDFEEGCLSIPDIHEEVKRNSKIKISYFDENWNFMEEEYSGVRARIIQHEYDHLEGKLFVDRIPTIRKSLIKRRLMNIAKGKINPGYRMIFPKKVK